jgi:hypothetical protein
MDLEVALEGIEPAARDVRCLNARPACALTVLSPIAGRVGSLPLESWCHPHLLAGAPAKRPLAPPTDPDSVPYELAPPAAWSDTKTLPSRSTAAQ